MPHVPHPMSLPQWVPLAVPSLRLLLNIFFFAGIFLRERLERNTTFGNDPGPHPLCCQGQNKGGLSRASCRSLNGCLCWDLWHRRIGGNCPPAATTAEEPPPANHAFLALLADP